MTVEDLRALHAPLADLVASLKASLQGKTAAAVREAAVQAGKELVAVAAVADGLRTEIMTAQLFFEDVLKAFPPPKPNQRRPQ